MKAFKSVLTAVFATLPAVYTAIAVWFFMPDTVAVHFGFNGEVDRWGSKYEAFVFPGIILLMYILFLVAKAITLRSADEAARSERNISVMETVFLCVFVLFNSLCAMLLIAMCDPHILSGGESVIYVIESAVIGVIFIILGAVMPKTRRNSMIGMRVHFAMDTDAHWRTANRAGGVALIAGGVCTAAAGLIWRSVVFILVMGISLAVFLTIAIIYSYVTIKREQR